MQVVRYYFSNGINCLFELPTDSTKKLLPKGIEPIEVTHGTSLLAVTMFNFTESPIGPYQELVISLFVVPLLGISKKHTLSAVFTLVVASGSQRAQVPRQPGRSFRLYGVDQVKRNGHEASSQLGFAGQSHPLASNPDAAPKIFPSANRKSL